MSELGDEKILYDIPTGLRGEELQKVQASAPSAPWTSWFLGKEKTKRTYSESSMNFQLLKMFNTSRQNKISQVVCTSSSALPFFFWLGVLGVL